MKIRIVHWDSAVYALVLGGVLTANVVAVGGDLLGLWTFERAASIGTGSALIGLGIGAICITVGFFADAFRVEP